ARVVFMNKNMMCQYRAVGHPIMCAVTEGLVDSGARAVGMDPAEIRRINVHRDGEYPKKSAQGMNFESLSHQESLNKILEMMDYGALCAERDRLRADGVWRGVGLASFIEVTNPSAMFYGIGGARISAQDGATMRLDARGNVFVSTGATEQGQGMETVAAQVAATAMGVPIERVRVISGDTEHTPYGGGTWASRAAGIGGEAIAQTGKALRAQILDVAGVMLQAEAEELDIRGGVVVDRETGAERIGLDEIGRICYFRPDTLPVDYQSELMATRHYVPKDYPFAFTNGVQGAYVELDAETGFLTLLNHWCVEDCGTVINPQMVDEQIRGGIVQGLGGALWEHCVYDEAGQLQNGTMADYLVPQSNETPDIECAHVVSMTGSSELGAKGAGEAGTCGAPAVVMNAVNDALAPFGAKVTAMPFTPGRILEAIAAGG
ncbi:MAG: molybdopterin-dependent oxidoreductase, partial [Defluviicoccus sp.]|nr:molybdopterin-dependent oxidoreductase [Defluviicoccus sp.]